MLRWLRSHLAETHALISSCPSYPRAAAQLRRAEGVSRPAPATLPPSFLPSPLRARGAPGFPTLPRRPGVFGAGTAAALQPMKKRAEAPGKEACHSLLRCPNPEGSAGGGGAWPRPSCGRALVLEAELQRGKELQKSIQFAGAGWGGIGGL